MHIQKKTEFDREDIFLSRQQMESKRLCEFILNQEPVLTKYSKMTGFFNCDSSVVGDAFHRKVMNDEIHKEYTGVTNVLMLKNLAKLLNSDADVWVRVPIIPGVNDTEEEMKNIRSFFT